MDIGILSFIIIVTYIMIIIFESITNKKLDHIDVIGIFLIVFGLFGIISTYIIMNSFSLIILTKYFEFCITVFITMAIFGLFLLIR